MLCSHRIPSQNHRWDSRSRRIFRQDIWRPGTGRGGVGSEASHPRPRPEAPPARVAAWQLATPSTRQVLQVYTVEFIEFSCVCSVDPGWLSRDPIFSGYRRPSFRACIRARGACCARHAFAPGVSGTTGDGPKLGAIYRALAGTRTGLQWQSRNKNNKKQKQKEGRLRGR